MKKLLFILAILSIAVPALAVEPIDFTKQYAMIVSGRPAPGGGSGLSMCPSSDASLLCETFDTAAGANSGFDNAWTCTSTLGTSTIDADNAHAGAFYCDTSTESLKLTRGDTDVQCAYTFGSTQTAVHAIFYMKLASIGSLTSTARTFFSLFRADGTEEYALLLRIYKGADNSHFKIYMSHKDSAESNISTSPTDEFEIGDVWHKIEVYYIWNNANGAKFSVDGTEYAPSEGNTETSDHAAYYVSKLVLLTIGVAHSLEFDNLKVDETASPACN
jgi:hypothetical protein